MFGQAAVGWDRPVLADVRAVLGAIRGLRVVLPGASLLRAAVSAWGTD